MRFFKNFTTYKSITRVLCFLFLLILIFTTFESKVDAFFIDVDIVMPGDERREGEVPIVLPYEVFKYNRETRTIVEYTDSSSTVTIPNTAVYDCNEYMQTYVYDYGSTGTFSHGTYWNQIVCNKLHYVDLKKIGDNVFKGKNITSLVFSSEPILSEIGSGAFESNAISGTLNIPKNVVRIGTSAFRYNQLTELNLVPYNPIYIGNYGFADNNLVKADLTFGTILGEYALYNNSLMQIEITNNCRLGYGALQKNSLTRIKLGSNVQLGNNLLSGNNSLREAYQRGGPGTYIGTQDGDWYKDISEYLRINSTTGFIYGYSNINGSRIVIPSSINGVEVKGIAPWTFSYCDLSHIIIPETVETIGDGAFRNNSLSSVEIPNGVTSIEGNAFTNNTIGLVKISDTVLYIGPSAFANNTYLHSVELGSSLTTIGDNAFANNNKLLAIVIPDNVTSIGEGAFTNNNMTTVQLGTKVYSIGKNAFANNRLTSVNFPASIRRIGEKAFYNNHLRSVEFPQNVDNIGDYAFAYNSLMEEVYLPQSLGRLGSNAFYNCYLKTIKIGAQVSIGDDLLDTSNTFRIAYLAEGPGIYKMNSSSRWVKGIVDSSCFTFDSATGTITGYNNEAGYDVIIPNSINGVAVTKIGDKAFEYKMLSKVVISSGVTSVGKNAFYFNNLTYISIPDSVTNIGTAAFTSNKLTDIQFGRGLTSLPTEVFSGNNLTSITIPGTITEIGSSAFRYNKLTELFLKQGVQSIASNAFVGNNLSRITIGSGVTIEPSMLVNNNNEFQAVYTSGGEGLYTVSQDSTWARNTDEKYFYCIGGTIDDYDVAGGTDVVIPEKIGGYSVVAIAGSAFAGKGLTSIKMPDTVTSICYSAFAHNSLNSAYISANLLGMGKSAFANNRLSSITIPENLTIIEDNAFINNLLTSVIIPANVDRIGNYAFRNNLISTVDLNDGLFTIGNYAFDNNKIAELVIPSSITDIEAYAFSNNSIASVEIPSTLTQLKEGIFKNNLLTSVIIPDDTITINKYIFAQNRLVSVTIPNSVYTISYGAFSNNQLIHVNLGNKVGIIEGYAFFDNKLETINIPSSVVTLGEYVFAYNSLVDVVIPNSVYDMRSYAFANNKLKSVDISNSLYAIRAHAFEKNLLESVTIPSSVNIIDDYAFAYNSLYSLTVPANVWSIGNFAFEGNRLTHITMEGYATIGDSMLHEGSTHFRSAYTGSPNYTNYSSNRRPEIYVGTQYGVWEKLVQINEDPVSKWEGDTLKLVLKYSGNLMSDVSGITKSQFALAFSTGGAGTLTPDLIEKTADDQLTLSFYNYPDISVAGGSRNLNYEIGEVPLRSSNNYYVMYPNTMGVSIASNDQTAMPTITEPIRGDDTEISGTAVADASVILSVNVTTYSAITAVDGNWKVTGLTLVQGENISVTVQAEGRTVSLPATAVVQAPRSDDATLSLNSKIKGVTLDSVGTPCETLWDLTIGYFYYEPPTWAGYVKLRPSEAADTSNLFETSFYTSDPKATVRVLKFPYSGDTVTVPNKFQNTTDSYNNEAIETTDFFVVKVTAARGNVLYYRIHLRMLPEVSATHVFIDKENFNLPKGSDIRLNATVEPSNTTLQDITWSSSDPNILSVSESGLATGVSSGTATITATTPEGIFDTVDITVINPMIMYDSGINGTLTATVDGVPISSGDLIPTGKDITFIATPDEGYHGKLWMVNGTYDEYCLENSLTINDFQQTTNVFIEFKAAEDYYTFDQSTGTITEYDPHGGVDVIIPSMIKGLQVKHIGALAFQGKLLTSVVLPTGLMSIGNDAFMGNLLQTLVIPEGVIGIGLAAFQSNNLVSVTFPSSLKNIGTYAFSNNRLTSLELKEGLESIGDRAFEGNSIISVNIPQSTLSIGNDAFRNNQITDLTIPEELKSIGEYAFSDNKIVNLVIGNGLTEVNRYAFANNLLTEVTIPDNIHTIGEMAFKNNKLTVINLGSNLATISDDAFADNLLDSIIIPDSVTSIGVQAFKGLTEDIIQLGVGYKDYFVYSDAERKVIKGHIGKPYSDLVIPDGVTSIGASAFSFSNLESITIPDSVMTISYNAFMGNYLNQIYLGSGLKTIGVQAFAQNQLTTITIPDGVTTIENWAFADNLLTSITIGSNVTLNGNLTVNTFNTSDKFNLAYNNGGAGTYTGVQYGEWSAVSHRVTISAEGQGTIEPQAGIYNYNVGENVSLKAVSTPDWIFEKWTINGVESTSSTTEVTIDKEITAIAYFGEPSGTITGIVKDNIDNRISGAAVRLTVSESVYGESTGEDGVYNLAGIPVGIGYTVTASKEGYISVRVDNIEVTSNGTTTVDFTLEPKPIIVVSPPTTQTHKADVRAGNGTETTLPITVNKDTGTASINIGSQKLTSGGIIITIPSTPDIDTYSVGIPISVLSTIEGQNTLTLNTDAGSIIVPSNMLTGVSETSENKAEITIGQGDKEGLPKDVKAAIGDRPLVQLTLTIDGKQTDWNNPSAPITVSIPYTPTAEELLNTESIVIWYIDGSGNVITIPNGQYNSTTGTVTFATTHFSDFAVAYHKVNFNDVAPGAWYNKAVSFIAAREITTGTGNGNYSPAAKLTRGEFIVLMMRAYGIAPDEIMADNFSDAGNTYYTSYLAAAKRLGISAGVGKNQYAPSREITRQEMFTLLYNALKAIGQLPHGHSSKTLTDFTDVGQINSWAKNAMTLLVETVAIGGNAGKLTPLSTTTRAEMAQVLYNLLEK